jgi:hypothetical protein
MNEEKILEAVKAQMDDPVKVIGFLEHQIDLENKMISLLILCLEQNGIQLPEELVFLRDNFQQGFLDASSVDFNDLSNPFQAYKMPLAIDKKVKTRLTQERYLMKKQANGML